MKRMLSMGMSALVASAMLVGCGGEEPVTEEPLQLSVRCDSPGDYIAFDAVNHAPQDLRLQRIDEMLKAFDDAGAAADIAAAGDTVAAKVLGIYQAPDANLQVKVLGRKDRHFTDARADVGAELDAAILDALQQLRDATTKTHVSVAKQYFQKAGTHRFLYLSTYQELAEPSYKHYDEAYGYLGTGPTNAAAGRRGLAALAASRDGNNGTTLAPELFAQIKDGACILEKALKTRGADSMLLTDDAAYAAHVAAMDAKLQVVFAYSLGHELFDLKFVTTDANARIKLAEADGFLRTLAPYLAAAGGDRAAFGTEVKTAIDDAKAAMASDPSWFVDFRARADALLTRLEAVYGIDVKA